MIEVIPNLPDNVAAFKATGEVAKEDYDLVVLPWVNRKIKENGKLNYLMLIETPLGNFTAGAWFKDMMLGLQKLTKWHRVAILTDSATANHITDIASLLLPGEYKGFTPEQLPEAIRWVSEEN